MMSGKSDYGLSELRFKLTHSMVMAEIEKTNGVLCTAFFKKMLNTLDRYAQFAPKGTKFEYNGKDDFGVLDLSIRDILNKNYGAAILRYDTTFKEVFNFDIKKKTLNDIIKSKDKGAASLASFFKTVEIPETVDWLTAANCCEPNNIIIASKNSKGSDDTTVTSNFMIVFYKTRTNKKRCLIAGYVDTDNKRM